ncbi:hypothetical protein J7T55_013089 [Diaporthe amygdali]|uniref:uncharacterized protein n=1 Tax=Phomopsis amygdali TaxID=1214568 RepID=UPI0022FEA7B1|nr:uncharacterized protein J7T55_013089 [Diaporthe amygdali]KAJ0118833.1 hypothetical protein J7T55_013089 [Diaporthe amygdali]
MISAFAILLRGLSSVGIYILDGDLHPDASHEPYLLQLPAEEAGHNTISQELFTEPKVSLISEAVSDLEDYTIVCSDGHDSHAGPMSYSCVFDTLDGGAEGNREGISELLRRFVTEQKLPNHK